MTRSPGEGRRRGRPPSIDLNAIVTSTVELGLDSFSVVGVAGRLGVSDAAIYRYIPTRGRLQALAADRIWCTLDPAVPGVAAWQDYAAEIAQRARQLARPQHGVARYVTFGPYEPTTVALFERLMHEVCDREPRLDLDRAFAVVSRVLRVALGDLNFDNEEVRRANETLFQWDLDVLLAGMAAAIERGELPPAVDWATLSAAVTLPPLDAAR